MLDQVQDSPARRSIEDLLQAARVALDMDLSFLSHIEDGEQEFEVVANPAGRIALPAGTRVAAMESYCSVMLRGDVPNVVADVRADAHLGPMDVTQALGIGAYCGVPVRLPDGSLYGTLCGLDAHTRPDLTADQVTVLNVIATLLGQQLQRLRAEQQAAEAARDELLSLLAPGSLRIVVQPIVDVRVGRPCGFEALSRFTGPDGGSRRPDHVFAEAARQGLGQRFEVAASSSALGLLPELPGDAYLSVNLSAARLSEPECLELLRGAEAGRVVLELTEHEAVDDYDEVVDVLADLRACGLRLAIDDVGAGFSSLRHILRLRPDVIKLDISLTRSLDADPARRALVAAFVAFSAEIDASLVAEGVETAQERAALEELGVHLMQGYLLGRPAPVGVAT